MTALPRSGPLTPDVPALTAWELRDGRYVQVAFVQGSDECPLTLPFPLTLRPADLVR